jgi:hypothetical protein
LPKYAPKRCHCDGNRGAGFARITLAQARDEKRLAVFEARRLQMREKCFVHFDRLHDGEGVELATRAQCFGREPELLAKRSRECFVRAVTGIDGDREDVGRAIGEAPRGFAQTACANVAHHRKPGGRFECAREVKARHAATTGDVVERQVVREMTFDKPERFSDRVHSGSLVSMKPA